LELAAWRDELFEVLGVDGVVSLDLDEKRNRVVVDVADPTARVVVARMIRDASVPPDAVLVEDGEYPTAASTLADYGGRPAPSGVAYFYHTVVEDDDCTLGFAARVGGIDGYFNASHCAGRGEYDDSMWKLDEDWVNFVGSTPMWLSQPFLDPNQYHTNRFGVEKYDPPGSQFCLLSSAGVWYGRCRYSDAAFIQVSAGVPWTLGKIARPTAYSTFDDWCVPEAPPSNPDKCIITLDSPPRSFYFDGERDSVVGQKVSKVGKKTGWTTGEVIATNVWDVVTTGTNPRVLMGQVHARLQIAKGDSGSPVFTTSATPYYKLLGLVSGYYWDPVLDDYIAIYSPISGIRKDFERYGTITTREFGVIGL
jgi:hypothetical protein